MRPYTPCKIGRYIKPNQKMRNHKTKGTISFPKKFKNRKVLSQSAVIN